MDITELSEGSGPRSIRGDGTMEIVVSWDYSDYECSGTETVCVKAPSVPGLKELFEAALKQYVADYELYSASMEVWNAKLRTLAKAYEKVKRSKRLGAAALTKYENHRKAQPSVPRPDGAFAVGSYIFCLESFVRYDYETLKKKQPVKRTYFLPEIQTLEDWFQSKCKD